jgi:hypothetical protein
MRWTLSVVLLICAAFLGHRVVYKLTTKAKIRVKSYQVSGQAWWGTPVIIVLGSLKQEDHKFKTSLGCIVLPCLKKKKKEKDH